MQNCWLPVGGGLYRAKRGALLRNGTTRQRFFFEHFLGEHMRTRRMRIGGGWCTVDKAWAVSSLHFVGHRGEERQEAVIEFRHPSEIANLRRRLSEIVASWKEALEKVEP